MKKFSKINECAELVFGAYVDMGYYAPHERRRALQDYRKERNKLLPYILYEEQDGRVVGTMMLAVDRGYMPTDIAFPTETAEFRKKFGGRLGYAGKFAVDPELRGNKVGMKLICQGVSWWVIRNGVDALCMMVNPRHVAFYQILGAKKIAWNEGTPGLDKAPAELMLLDVAVFLERVKRLDRSQQKESTSTPVRLVA